MTGYFSYKMHICSHMTNCLKAENSLIEPDSSFLVFVFICSKCFINTRSKKCLGNCLINYSLWLKAKCCPAFSQHRQVIAAHVVPPSQKQLKLTLQTCMYICLFAHCIFKNCSSQKKNWFPSISWWHVCLLSASFKHPTHRCTANQNEHNQLSWY